mgnify:CR=1 FL=1
MQQDSQTPSHSAVSDGAAIVSDGEVDLFVSFTDETSVVAPGVVWLSAVQTAMVHATNNAVVSSKRLPPAALAHPIQVNERISENAI